MESIESTGWVYFSSDVGAFSSNATPTPGNVVMMYTDGVTEAVNADNQMFGDERLEELVKQSVSLSAEEIKLRILDDVLSFTAGLPQGDDITLIVLKMKARP